MSCRLKELGRYQKYTGMMWTTAAVIGPTLGGVLTDYWHWTLIFWINLPLGLIAFVLPNRALKHLPTMGRPHKLDILGSFLMIAAAVSMLHAVTSGGVAYPWISLPIISLFVVSAALWMLFIWRLRTAPAFLPLEILSNRIVRVGAILSACNISCFIGLAIFIPLYFLLVQVFRPTFRGCSSYLL